MSWAGRRLAGLGGEPMPVGWLAGPLRTRGGLPDRPTGGPAGRRTRLSVARTDG
ncbi:hypothetical protein [Nonomuraea sp. NEAU-A123]|uniref:hypothetical protein n=1 Tax=Nonomuraea sp. NEAU-A123 TaxID=2839649 RepID=UPI001BE4DF70|nr:hypothetical protein [Nonomuraea sp. NEAU-A123]MBT2225379.1 hypothetical protein [Nonomuraea sp. NEAU-A123]